MGSHEWSAHRLYFTDWVLYFMHSTELLENPRIQWCGLLIMVAPRFGRGWIFYVERL